MAMLLLAATVPVGCIGGPSNPAATQPATAIDPATTQPAYWLARPDAATIDAGDFDKLWAACEHAIRQSTFRIDRQDYRTGLLTTEPVASKQFFEFWRGDSDDLAESSLSSIRRTIYFQFTRESESHWSVAPKVLVEREVRVEPKLQAVVPFDPTYWYPVRRDERMEKRLADRVRDRLAER